MTETKHTPQIVAEVKRIAALRVLPTTRDDAEDGYTYAREVVALRNSHTALVAALRTFVGAYDAVVEATGAYLPPDGISEQECLNRILAATDNLPICHARAEVRAALSAEGEKDAPKDDAWIEWKGGECPVPGDTMVEIKAIIDDKDGTKPSTYEREGADQASWFDCFDWWTGGNRVTITAYRVVKP